MYQLILKSDKPILSPVRKQGTIDAILSNDKLKCKCKCIGSIIEQHRGHESGRISAKTYGFIIIFKSKEYIFDVNYFLKRLDGEKFPKFNFVKLYRLEAD